MKAFVLIAPLVLLGAAEARGAETRQNVALVGLGQAAADLNLGKYVLASASDPGVLNAENKNGIGVVALFNPAWTAPPTPDAIYKEYPDRFKSNIKCSDQEWAGCCPKRKDTIWKLTAFGWFDTQQACGPSGDHGEPPKGYTPEDDPARIALFAKEPKLAEYLINQMDLNATARSTTIIATTGLEGRPVYLVVHQPPQSDLCSGTVKNVCWTTSSGSTKCEDRSASGLTDRKWRKTYCSPGPWETVGDCAC